MIIPIIGRGHGGTRIIAEVLFNAGVYLGAHRNESWDLLPADYIYTAAKMAGREVHYLGGYDWEFVNLTSRAKAPELFQVLMRLALQDHLHLKDEARPWGWKLPESTLAYPWLVKMFPDAHFIWWVRHPLDVVLGEHITDRLGDWSVDAPEGRNVMEDRALSWLYQYKIVAETPRPKHLLMLRYEDWVLHQADALTKLEEYTGLEVEPIEVDAAPVGRWKHTEWSRFGIQDDDYLGFLGNAAEELGYDWPRVTVSERRSDE